MESGGQEQVLRGVVERIIYRNPENGFAVMQFDSEGGERLTVVGHAINIKAGAHLVVKGTLGKHPKYGNQFKAESITITDPSTATDILRYLASGVIKGIGKGTASKIVKEFGKEAINVIYNSPEKLATVEGVGRHRAQLISKAFAQRKEEQEIERFLIERSIPRALAHRIYKRYGARAIEIISNDPYQLAMDPGMRGVGFITADEIARERGLTLTAPARIKAGIYYALQRASDDGHCFLSREDLNRRAHALLSLEEPIDIEPFVQALVDADYLNLNQFGVYLKNYDLAEIIVANFIAARGNKIANSETPRETVKATLRSVEAALKVELSDEQKQCAFAATEYPLLVITGGPGAGKTTVIRAITSLFSRINKSVLLAAPTGRAAQRMSQVTGLEAKTIHRLLGYDPGTGGFRHNTANPLTVNGREVDALIVDEASMIDLLLARDLVQAIPKNARLILVGDKDQLPSVGAGRVFADIISVEEVQTIRLTQLYRRSEESAITTAALQINAGEIPAIPEPNGETKSDAYFVARSDPEEAAQTLVKLVSDQIPRRFGISREEIAVLSPSNRGPLGTVALNALLQEAINPREARRSGELLPMGDFEFRLGDAVCQRRNNYDLDEAGVFNGDTGTVISIDKENNELVVQLWDKRIITYSTSDLAQLSLSYCVTVHRSQGNEFPCVVLALHDSQYGLLERQLLYTAVTRAKKLLIVVGSKRAFTIGCRRTPSGRRCTALGERIRENLAR